MRVLACLLLAAGVLIADDPLVQTFKQAVEALNKGDYLVAEAGFQEVLRTSPKHLPTLQNLGVVYSRMGRSQEAIATYRRALELSPKDQSLQFNLGVAYLKADSYTDAMSVFQRLGSTRIRDTDLLFRLASGYLSQNPSLQARTSLEAFLGATPAANFVLCKIDYAAGRYEEAARECRQTNVPGARRELGKVLVSQNSPEALGELSAAVKENPDDAEALSYLGVALMAEDRSADAARYLERAIELDANSWGSYFYLGKAMLQLRQTAEAVPLLEKAAALNPNAAVVFYELGRALLTIGKSDDGRRALDRVRELRAAELHNDAEALRKR